MSGNRGNQIVNDIRQALETRQRLIGELRELAENHDQLARAYNEKRQAPRGTSMVGGVLTAVSGGTVFVTSVASGGLAAPLWASLIGLTGTGVGVFGGIWGMTVEKKKRESEDVLKRRIEELLREDAEMHRLVVRAQENLALVDYEEQAEVLRQVRTVVYLYMGLNDAFGSTTALGLFLGGALTPIALFCDQIVAVSSFLGPVITKGIELWRESGCTELADEIAVEVTKSIQPGITRVYIREQAKLAANSIKGPIQDEVAEEALKKAMESAAKAARDEAIKTVNQWTGALTFGVGIAFAVWDLVELREAVANSHPDARSRLGNAFRQIADQLEAEMRRRDRG